MVFVSLARQLLRAKDLADARYFEPLGVDDLARAAGFSRAHFIREFRRAFGESPHARHTRRRPIRRWFRAAYCASTVARNVALFEKTAPQIRTRIAGGASNRDRRTDDQVCQRPVVGARPGGGSRLLYPQTRLGV